MPGRLLLITPQFYGIEQKIKSALEEFGYEVSWIENKTLLLDYHGTKAKFRFLRKLYFIIFSPNIRYLREEFKKIETDNFDILLSVNANIICPFLIQKLKKANPRLLSVVYFWDSFSKYNFKKELILFDKAFTFDPKDAIKLHIEYKPNFYIKPDSAEIAEEKFDLFFVGKFSPERFALLDRIKIIIESQRISSFIKIWPAYKILLHNFFIYRFLRGLHLTGNWFKHFVLNYEAVEGILDRDYLTAHSLDFSDVQYNLQCSNVILDITSEKQTGFSHRLIEALATGKKILTTNHSILQENFYNPEQVHIVEIKDPVIDCEWIKKRSGFHVDSSFAELELSRWLKSLIDAEIV